MSGAAVAALRRALETGDAAPMAACYADGAVLDASLPGLRSRHRGAIEIEGVLSRWWPVEAPAQLDAREWATGAAAWTLRDDERLRHYLHVDDKGLISGHWVYAAAGPDDAPAPSDELLGRMGATVAPGAFGGNSGASVVRVRLADGTPRILKRAATGLGWLARALGGTARSVELWNEGVLARLPPDIDHAIEAVEPDGDAWWLVMRDVGELLIGDERRISRAEHRRVFEAAAALHRAFAGEEIVAAATAAQRLSAAAPALADIERDGDDLLPKQIEIAWECFAQVVDADVADAVLGFHLEPDRFERLVATLPQTLCHGDLRDDNLGFDGERVVLLDWDIAFTGSPAVELGWTLCHDAWRTDATRDELVADLRAAEGDLVDDRALDVLPLAALALYGWIIGHSAVVHPDPAERAWARDELGFWVPWARRSLERL